MSWNVDSFDVVNRSQRMGRSSFYEWSEDTRIEGYYGTYSDAAPVVLYLQQLQASILNSNLDGASSGVQCILKQFF